MFLRFSLLCFISVFLLNCSAQVETKSKKNKKLPPYKELLDSVEKKRLGFLSAYNAATESEKPTIIQHAQTYLLTTITNDFFAQWYGTEWDFNGTTHEPRKGKIACGYFITTVLEDAGFNIPRTKWAQQASEYYITRMTADVKRFSNQSVEKVKEYFLNRPDGLYIAGLDNHVGFVFKSGESVTFTHASYYDPKIGVQTEELNGDNPFAKSGYRVIGRILDTEMVKKWILGEEWEF